MSSAVKLTPRMVEKAGLGLVIWNLARRGIECLPTTENSSQGDLWAKLLDGQMIRIEVKAMTSTGWHIRRGQALRADCFVFVSIHDARCWVLSQEQVALAIAEGSDRGECVVITKAKMPASAADSWSGLSASQPKQPRSYRSARVVRKVLADGTTKTYRYPAYNQSQPTNARA
jgi:hypothetical protein